MTTVRLIMKKKKRNQDLKSKINIIWNTTNVIFEIIAPFKSITKKRGDCLKKIKCFIVYELSIKSYDK